MKLSRFTPCNKFSIKNPVWEMQDQEEAKQALINDLEFIIGTNGVGELDDTEKELITLVGGCELCGSIPMTVNCNNANCDSKK